MTETEIKTELQRVRVIRADGGTWQEIGDHIGLTRQGAINRYQALLADIPSPHEKKDVEWRDTSDTVTIWLEGYGPVTRGTVMEEFSLSTRQFEQLDIPRNLILAPSKSIGRTWSDDQIKRQLRRANREMDKGNLTTQRYLDWYEEQKRGSVISLPGLLVRFGTWNAACEFADVPHGTSNREYTRTFSREDVLLAVHTFIEDQVEAGERVTYARYDEAQRHHESWPSGSTCRNTMRTGWTEIVRLSATS